MQWKMSDERMDIIVCNWRGTKTLFIVKFTSDFCIELNRLLNSVIFRWQKANLSI